MSLKVLFIIQLCLFIITPVKIGPRMQKRRVLTTTKDGFELDGQTFRVYAGEIHYFRLAPCSWHDRLKKLRSVGFNTVSTAIEWSTHEPKPEVYKWHGSANIIRFIELAFQLNLFVIVRIGPFIDSDRDLGGLPRWLLSKTVSKNKQQVLRQNPEYRHYVEKWFQELLPKLASLTIDHGGPIILFQIDSDLGDYVQCGKNQWLYDLLVSYLGKQTLVFTMNDDLYQSIFCGHINGTFAAIRTNPLKYSTIYNSSITKLFAPVQELTPGSPKLVELRSGTSWFWGGRRLSYASTELKVAFSDMISNGISVILYMFAGGTNFERSGCSASNENGMVTSYDYDAPVSETGDLTEKYFFLKSILRGQNKLLTSGQNFSKTRSQALYGTLNFTYVGSLLDPIVRRNFGILPLESQHPLMFHEMDDASAEMVLYETIIPEEFIAQFVEIHCKSIQDQGYVYIDQKLVGVMNQTRHTIKIINQVAPGQLVQILVENQGYRVHPVFADHKGILSTIYLDRTPLRNWTIHVISFEDIKHWQNIAEKMKSRHRIRHGNAIYRATFITPPNYTITMDSILDVRKMGKGLVFLNEYSIGKFWPKMGPQLYLYVPRCFIKSYPIVNRILVIEQYGRSRSKKSKFAKHVAARKKYAEPSGLSVVSLSNPILIFISLLLTL